MIFFIFKECVMFVKTLLSNCFYNLLLLEMSILFQNDVSFHNIQAINFVTFFILFIWHSLKKKSALDKIKMQIKKRNFKKVNFFKLINNLFFIEINLFSCGNH